MDKLIPLYLYICVYVCVRLMSLFMHVGLACNMYMSECINIKQVQENPGSESESPAQY